jgi:tRNA pseudouridine32 synthase/23S rRNA pseudouridine746 synthase
MKIKAMDAASLTILHCDDELLILDKPAGLAVHPGPRTPFSLEALLPALARRLDQKQTPLPLHRLDRDTSGCLLLARRKSTAGRLTRLFEARQVEKIYWALLERLPDQDSGLIEAPLAKISHAATGWRMAIDKSGQPARTLWRILDRRAGLVEFQPQTGRTHQLRVHALCLGSAIMGDQVYGSGSGPMRLHARQLRLPRLDGTALVVKAPLPHGWPDLPS